MSGYGESIFCGTVSDREARVAEIALKSVLRLFDNIRKKHPDMPMAQAHVLLRVAAAGDQGISMSDLARETYIGQASCSRYVAALGKLDRHRETGMDLVRAVEDPLERRKKIVTLTGKGRAYVNTLLLGEK